MSVISKLKVWIGSDTGSLEKGLKKSKKEVSAFSSGMKKLGGMIAGAFAVNSVVSFAKECLNLNKVQADAEKKLAAVIKATGGAAGLTAGEMKKYASQLQDLTTYGDEVTIDAMAIMSTFKSIKGDVFKQAIASAQDMATVLNTDLNAAVMQIGKALETPEVGLTALRRSGVSFSKEQIKQIKQLVAEGKKQEAQLIMLKELQNEFGGAAKAAAGDAYGAATQLTNAWGDLKETIGGMITPSEEAIGALRDGVKSVNHLITDESIPAWKKWSGLLTAGFAPLLNMFNYKNLLDETDVNSQREEATQNEIESLKLSEKHLYQLKMLLVGYLNLEDRANLSKDRIIAAINEEIKKRDQGIMAETEAQRISREAAAQKIKAEQENKQAIQDTVDMEEKSIEAIGKKVKAFQTLKAATDITDQASLDYYNKEIARLNTLINKTDELSRKRLLDAKKRSDGGAVEIPAQVYGIKEAANEFKAISQTLSSELLGSVEKMKPVAGVFDKVRDTIEKINQNGFNSQNLAALGVSIESITGNTIDLQQALCSLDSGVQIVGQLREAVNSLKEAGRFDDAKLVQSVNKAFQGLVTGAEVSRDALAELNKALQEITIGFAESIGNLIAGTGDLKGFGALVAEVFGNMLINIGKAAIAAGIGIRGIQLSLKSLNPFAAAAAGAALIALGTALKSSLGKIADGGTTPTFSSHVLSGSGITDTRTNPGIDNAAKPVEVIVRGDFKLRGSTLVAAVESENARKKITT